VARFTGSAATCVFFVGREPQEERAGRKNRRKADIFWRVSMRRTAHWNARAFRSLANWIQWRRRRSCFMSSEYCEDVETDQAEERADRGAGEDVAEEMHSEDDARGSDQQGDGEQRASQFRIEHSD
jgi:hypothetical protein